MSPVTETVLERGADLATEHYCVQESKDSKILAFEKGKIQVILWIIQIIRHNHMQNKQKRKEM